jgi:hypothetical protein
MTFYVTFIIKAHGVRKSDVELTYKHKWKTSPDTTNKNGEVITKWEDRWLNEKIEVFCNGRSQGDITLSKKAEYIFELNKSGCFPANTNIKTPSGVQKISTISVGDEIVTYDTDKNSFSTQIVISKIKHDPAQIHGVEFSSGRKIFLTEQHRLLTSHGFVMVKKLKCGDVIVANDNSRSSEVVVKISRTDRVEAVYNLITSKNYTFIADDVIAHSFSNWVVFQEFYWNIRYFCSSFVGLISLAQKGKVVSKICSLLGRGVPVSHKYFTE